jgi:hypothetical protein
MIRWLIVLVFVMVLVAACSDDGDQDKDGGDNDARPATPVTPSLSITLSPSPENLSNRPTLEAQAEALRQSQQAIEAIWSDLQAGQTVACTTTVTLTVPPGAITGDDAVSGLLFQTAVAIDQAVALWEAECQNPRTQPPAATIDRGLREALAAADALDEARQLLAD